MLILWYYYMIYTDLRHIEHVHCQLNFRKDPHINPDIYRHSHGDEFIATTGWDSAGNPGPSLLNVDTAKEGGCDDQGLYQLGWLNPFISWYFMISQDISWYLHIFPIGVGVTPCHGYVNATKMPLANARLDTGMGLDVSWCMIVWHTSTSGFVSEVMLV